MHSGADPGELIASYALSEDPENDLFLNVYERDFSEEPGTKGEVKTTSKLSTFKMLAYANGEWHDNTIADGQPGSATSPHAAGLYFGGTDGIDVNRSGSAGSYDWNIATDQYWLNEVSISFWSWNGVKPAVAWNSSTSCYDKASLTGFSVAGVNGTEVNSQIDPIFAYNGQLSTTVTTPSGTGTVRCIRDLGTGSEGTAMSSVAVQNGDINAGQADKIYVLTASNVSSTRSKITGREVSGTIDPGSGIDAEDNELYSRIQVANKYLTWPVSGATQPYTKFEYNLAVNQEQNGVTLTPGVYFISTLNTQVGQQIIVAPVGN